MVGSCSDEEELGNSYHCRDSIRSSGGSTIYSLDNISV